MKKIITLLALIALSIGAYAQSEDSTYTTFSTVQIEGNPGADTCIHEWFTTVLDITEDNVRTKTTSRQCVNCGKQNATIDTWTTYIKEEEVNDEE